ncbi:hypothetical protein J6590_015860 [Homalodisca vitripennis]|nr:hypothetical protein J6590_015860 [Homalodisca vitripennis]
MHGNGIRYPLAGYHRVTRQSNDKRFTQFVGARECVHKPRLAAVQTTATNTQKKSIGFRTDDQGAHDTGPSLPIHLPQVWFRRCLTSSLKCEGAPSCINQQCSLTSQGTSSKKSW